MFSFRMIEMIHIDEVDEIYRRITFCLLNGFPSKIHYYSMKVSIVYMKKLNHIHLNIFHIIYFIHQVQITNAY